MWEDVCKLFANTMLFYRRDLRIHEFWYPWGSWGGVLEIILYRYTRGQYLLRARSNSVSLILPGFFNVRISQLQLINYPDMRKKTSYFQFYTWSKTECYSHVISVKC